MSDLDKTFSDAAEISASLRHRDIPWAEQREFFLRHLWEYPGDQDMVMERAELGYAQYGDNTFWYPRDSLVKMEEEELVDAFVYNTISRYRSEIIGEYSLSLGDSEPEAKNIDVVVHYRGAENICDECCLQYFVKSERKLICKSLHGCVMER